MLRRVLISVTLTAATAVTTGSSHGYAPVLTLAHTAPPPSVAPSTPSTPASSPAEPFESGSLPSTDEPSRPGAAAVGSEVLFVGDYETGDFSQWGTCQSVVLNSSCSAVAGSHHSMQILESPDAREGQFAARFEVRSGDVPDFGGGERSEVKGNDDTSTHEGDERWYQWSMQFPDDFTNPEGGWFVVMQWHSGSGSPPLAINISNEGTVDILWNSEGIITETIGPVRRGEWVDYTLHVKFSNDDSTGFVEAWENDTQTVPTTYRATMSSDENDLKQGIYRDPQSATHVVWLDGLRVTGPPQSAVDAVLPLIPFPSALDQLTEVRARPRPAASTRRAVGQ